MTRRDWRIGGGAIACIALAVAFGLALQPRPLLLDGAEPGRDRSNFQLAPTACASPAISQVSSAGRRDKPKSCSVLDEQRREKAAELATADRSAAAAEASAYYAWQQSRIAAYAGAIGLLTLLAAISAAIFAGLAAHHTKASADSYKAREKAELVPMIQTTTYVLETFAKNLGPTKAILLIANSALFPDPPPDPVPFLFPGHGRMSIAVEGDSQYDFGRFDIPQGATIVYLIGGIIYETVFGEVRLMRASFRVDLAQMRWDPYDDLDWRLWEEQVAKVKRNRS
jgi:hypothetical protein